MAVAVAVIHASATHAASITASRSRTLACLPVFSVHYQADLCWLVGEDWPRKTLQEHGGIWLFECKTDLV